MDDLFILLRSVHFGATVLVAGSVAFVALVADPAAGAVPPPGYPRQRRRLVWLVWIALAAAIMSGVAWLLAVAGNILALPLAEAWRQGGLWTVLTETRFGAVAGARLALAATLGVLMTLPSARWLTLAAAAGFAALPALVGHAGAQPGTAGTVHLASDMTHLVAAAAWLGSLPALIMLLARAEAGADTAWPAFAVAAVRRYSVLGVVCVGGLLVTGIINSWNLLDGVSDLTRTDYGRLLAFKIGLFLAMAATATFNRYYLTPRLPAPAPMRALRATSLAEIVLGLCVLSLAAALGTMVPGGHAHTATPAIPDDAAFVHIHSSEAMAEVTINPGQAGKTAASIRVMREDMSDFAAKDVTMTLDPPASGLARIERKAVAGPDGTWGVADLTIPAPGIWTLRVIIGTGAGAPIVLDAPIEIAPCADKC